MKTFIPHVYFSAPEDTVGDLVNQIRRESEIPGTAEPKPEMKDSGKKSIIPKTVVSAPEKDTVGDLIEQLHKEPEAIPEEKPEEKTEQPEKTEGKKSIIPKTVVSAAKSELDRVYDLLTSGEDLQMNPDGTLKAIRIEGTEYKGKALLDKVDQLVRTAYFDADDSPEKDFAMDYIWYLWEGKDSPLFDKSRMATFERCFIDDKSVQKEEKGAYYSLREEESVCDMLLDEFGVTGRHRHIINGHVPKARTRSRQTGNCLSSTAASPKPTTRRQALQVIPWSTIRAASSLYSTNRSCRPTRPSRRAKTSVRPPSSSN